MTKICGIYKITSPTEKIYIGQSINIISRWAFYKTLNCKHQSLLFYSLKKHGAKNHRFEIIHQCHKDELNKLERHYIKLYDTFNSKHGLNLDSGGGLECTRVPFSDEHKRKIGLSKIGIKRPDVSRRFTELNRSKRGDKNHNFRKEFSNSERLARRNAQKVKLSELDIVNIKTEYSSGEVSQLEIAKKYNVSQSMISLIVLDKKSWKNEEFFNLVFPELPKPTPIHPNQ